jgi:hypothetical protein
VEVLCTPLQAALSSLIEHARNFYFNMIELTGTVLKLQLLVALVDSVVCCVVTVRQVHTLQNHHQIDTFKQLLLFTDFFSTLF